MAPDGGEHDALARARSAGTWLGGLLLLGLLVMGLVAVAVELWRHLDVGELLGTSRSAPAARVELPRPPASSSPSARAGDGFRVVLLRNRPSAEFYPDSTFYGSAAAGWRSRAAGLGAAVEEVRTASAVRGLSPEAVVVAPGTLCLSVETGLALQAHLDRGGAVVAVGPVGTRDAGCGWRGWEFLESLAGATRIRELPEREALYLTVPGGPPLSAGLDPGTRVEMRYARPLAAVVPGALPYWSDWGLSPAPGTRRDGGDTASRPVAAAALREAEGGGRVAWLGFHPSRAAGPRDSAQAGRLARNALAWAARLPVATLEPWPGGARAALLLAQEVESRAENARVLADVAADRGVPATFFVASRLLPDRADGEGEGALAARLRAAGEVAAQTADHRPVAGRPLDDQRLALRRSLREIEEWAGVAPVGLSPPEDRVDRATLRAWREVGGRYLLTTNDARRASPEVFRTPAGPVTLLPRVMPDDYTLYVDQGMERRSMIRPLLRSLEKIRKLRGLAAPTFHTPLAGLESRGLLRSLVDSARADGGWWWATGREVGRWWRSRAGAGLAVEPAGEGALRVRLAAAGDFPLRDARLRVFPPDPAGPWRASSAGRRLTVSAGEWGLAVELDSVPAGDTVTVRLMRR